MYKNYGLRCECVIIEYSSGSVTITTISYEQSLGFAGSLQTS